jgi:hypothetical protein
LNEGRGPCLDLDLTTVASFPLDKRIISEDLGKMLDISKVLSGLKWMFRGSALTRLTGDKRRTKKPSTRKPPCGGSGEEILFKMKFGKR